jgi:hypothetical protein
MGISKRVTARYYKRVRTASPASASPSVVRREESDMRNLPAVETHSPAAEGHSDLVSAHAQISRPTHAEISTSISLWAHLRDARARAEQILRDHPRPDGRTGATCQPCLVDYPCDAVRAAEDVIAITDKLRVRRLDSSKDLLKVMTELIGADRR